MMIWIVIALLTCVAVLSVLWPLSGPAPAPGEDAADVAFYRAQIAEIDAEMSRGAIAPDQAEAAKAEAGRRLLAVAPAEAAAIDSPVARARAVALATFCVPLIALGIYARIGSPQLADMPPEATRNAAPEQTGLAGAVGKMESYLDAHKDDGRALELMTPAYLQMGRFDDAVKSSRRAIEILGESPDRLATYAEALSYANDGIVSPEAVDQLERALALDAKNLRARFFLGLAAAQHDDSAKAQEI
jgi:cytochrome c-type biogenesis protein CcmH